MPKVDIGEQDNEEWISFLNSQLKEHLREKTHNNTNTNYNLVSMIIAPLRNVNAEAEVLLKALQIVALPFTSPNSSDRVRLLESYSRLQVLSHVYLGLCHLWKDKAASEALNLASEILVRLTFESDLCASEFVKAVRLRDRNGETLRQILSSDNGNLSGLQMNVLSVLSKVSRLKTSNCILESIFTERVIERCCETEKCYLKLCLITFGWLHRKNAQEYRSNDNLVNIVKQDPKFIDLGTKLPKNIAQFFISL